MAIYNPTENEIEIYWAWKNITYLIDIRSNQGEIIDIVIKFLHNSSWNSLLFIKVA